MTTSNGTSHVGYDGWIAAPGDRLRHAHLRVLIEVQKARYSNDVMRFRRYLGMHYADERNTVTYAEGGCERKRPRRLTTIAEQQEAIAARDATIESQRAEIEAPKSATSSCAEIAR